MIDYWSDDFIPLELQDNMIYVDEPDRHEREGYMENLQIGNHENGRGGFDNENGSLMTGSISTDINGERQNIDKRMLDTVL
jgi:hypothetical protein